MRRLRRVPENRGFTIIGETKSCANAGSLKNNYILLELAELYQQTRGNGYRRILTLCELLDLHRVFNHFFGFG